MTKVVPVNVQPAKNQAWRKLMRKHWPSCVPANPSELLKKTVHWHSLIKRLAHSPWYAV